jgi:hypothetical protein
MPFESAMQGPTLKPDACGRAAGARQLDEGAACELSTPPRRLARPDRYAQRCEQDRASGEAHIGRRSPQKRLRPRGRHSWPPVLVTDLTQSCGEGGSGTRSSTSLRTTAASSLRGERWPLSRAVGVVVSQASQLRTVSPVAHVSVPSPPSRKSVPGSPNNESSPARPSRWSSPRDPPRKFAADEPINLPSPHSLDAFSIERTLSLPAGPRTRPEFRSMTTDAYDPISNGVEPATIGLRTAGSRLAFIDARAALLSAR